MFSVRRTARAFAHGLLAAFSRYVLYPIDGFFYAIHRMLERFRCRHVGPAVLLLEPSDDEDFHGPRPLPNDEHMHPSDVLVILTP